MKKFIFILKRIKNIFNNQILKIFLISLVTMIITIGILFAVVWHYRSNIFNFIASNYIPQTSILQEVPIALPKIEEAPVPIALKEEIKEEGTVITAVKKAKPAVVSIVITKETPKYDIKYEDKNATDSSGKIIPDVFIRTPVYVPNGVQNKQVGSGSGFIISSDGMIVTNRHVVDKTDVKYTVLLNSGVEYVASVLARDPVLDVAVLKIEAKNLPYLKLANSDLLEVGQSVVAIGNALGEFKNTVSAGVISGLSRSLLASGSGGFKEFLYKVIQTDAAINPGNSGGPLLNLEGDVVGINVAIADGSSNIGFSLPINSVKEAIDQVKKTGKISRPYVGVRYTSINQELKAKLNLPVDYGVLVQKGPTAKDVAVIPGSPADKAGILENDIILSIDGEIINANNDFASLIRYKKIGDKIKLKIISGGIEKTVTVKLEGVPENI